MLHRRIALVFTPCVLLLAGCSRPPDSAAKQPDPLRQELEALRARQAQTETSVNELRDFLRVATGGRFAPGLIGVPFDIAGAPSEGNSNAPVTMVEISDYHCPFCRVYYQQTASRIDADFVKTGKVRHVFVHYPLVNLHPSAPKSHEAAMCAADQGKFWEMHAKLFASPSAVTPDQVAAIAQGAGVDGTRLRECLGSAKYAKAVADSVARVEKLNITGTPAFFIGRTPSGSEPFTIARVLEGAQAYQTFKLVLDEVAAGK